MSYREDLRDDAYVIATFVLTLPEALQGQVAAEVQVRTMTGPESERVMYRMVRFALEALDAGVLHDDDFFDLFEWEDER